MKCQDRGLNTGPPETGLLQSVALPAELPRRQYSAVFSNYDMALAILLCMDL